MSSLGSTDRAGLTTDDKNLYLFYQRSGYIVEAFSEEGGPPTQTSVQVAADAQSGGSPLTAYYVKEDMNYDKHSTVCVHRSTIVTVALLTAAPRST